MKQSVRGGAASLNEMKPIYTNAYLIFALVRFDPTMLEWNDAGRPTIAFDAPPWGLVDWQKGWKQLKA